MGAVVVTVGVIMLLVHYKPRVKPATQPTIFVFITSRNSHLPQERTNTTQQVVLGELESLLGTTVNRS